MQLAAAQLGFYNAQYDTVVNSLLYYLNSEDVPRKEDLTEELKLAQRAVKAGVGTFCSRHQMRIEVLAASAMSTSLSPEQIDEMKGYALEASVLKNAKEHGEQARKEIEERL